MTTLDDAIRNRPDHTWLRIEGPNQRDWWLVKLLCNHLSDHVETMAYENGPLDVALAKVMRQYPAAALRIEEAQAARIAALQSEDAHDAATVGTSEG